MLLLEIDTDTGTAGIVNGSMELLDFLETAEISLHTFHQSIHLLQSTTIRQIGIGIQHYFLVTGEVTALIDFLHKKAQ